VGATRCSGPRPPGLELAAPPAGRGGTSPAPDAGRAKLEEASKSHVVAVRELFDGRFSDEEATQLAHLLGRLPGGEDAAAEECAPPERR